MERSRLALVTLMCVLLFSQNRMYGAEVEIKVRPGDNITLYCDRSLTLHFNFVWIRNCSHENQPSLIINVMSLDLGTLKRFSSVYNRSSNSYDLHINNISVSDLGLYYCAEVENKVFEDEKGRTSGFEVYYYGNQKTRLSLAEEVTSCSGLLNITSTPRVSDCVLCWTLLFSVCPVCVLLSSICLFCLCQRKTTDAVADQKDLSRGRNTIEGEDEEVCYASLDVKTRRQKQRKTKRVQCSDFSTYAQVRTDRE
ncbi:uncharacterized protein LOC127518759 isoform X2 [Ctenopharyngodon idella]|uniref:uncharacterized protein LOC127518759 isoform X2 n=1 Tax=Ctenopharyngodon idella TaxID=7959 RepID=UPI002230AD5C|nr:uncharacterized protein LOC127518759 isoform X2 [Ctenopharyngodon idella]